MAKRSGVVTIGLSLVMGVGAAWLAGTWLKQAGQAQEVEMATVVAADLPIPFGTKVESRHLKVLEIPAAYVPPGSYRTIEEVVDRVTVQPIVSGEILMKERFVDSADGSTLAAMVADNKRAVTVRVDDVIGVAGFLLPGNRVDIVASRREENRRAVAETVLRDVKVLAVDQTAATEKNEPVIVRAVTLEVSPQQAEALVKAREEGSIQLTLRNPMEEEPQVVQEPPKPPVRRTAPSAPSTRSITVIRGTDVSTTRARS